MEASWENFHKVITELVNDMLLSGRANFVKLSRVQTTIQYSHLVEIAKLKAHISSVWPTRSRSQNMPPSPSQRHREWVTIHHLTRKKLQKVREVLQTTGGFAEMKH